MVSQDHANRGGPIGRSVLALLLVGGCGASDPGADVGDGGLADAGGGSGPLLPWAVGNSWTYRVTEAGTVTMKTTTIGALELVGGTGPHRDELANNVVTAKGANDRTVSWQTRAGALVVRYREQSFHAATGTLELDEQWSPHKLHLDESAEHTAVGASWLEVYDETKLPTQGAASTATARDRWTVIADGELVTVPAGSFRALVIQKAGGSAAKTYWFARGVGKVKEVGDQTEELASFVLAP